MRLRLAQLPYVKTFDQLDFAFQPSIDERQIRKLRTPRFVHEANAGSFQRERQQFIVRTALNPGPRGRPSESSRSRLVQTVTSACCECWPVHEPTAPDSHRPTRSRLRSGKMPSVPTNRGIRAARSDRVAAGTRTPSLPRTSRHVLGIFQEPRGRFRNRDWLRLRLFGKRLPRTARFSFVLSVAARCQLEVWRLWLRNRSPHLLST